MPVPFFFASTGALVEQYSYDVFGEPTIMNATGTVISTSAYNNRFLFTGGEYLASMDLYLNRKRFYSARLGRFLQTDPIGHDGDSYNIYRYCGNDPVNNSDPFGYDDTDSSGSVDDSGTGLYSIGSGGAPVPQSNGTVGISDITVSVGQGSDWSTEPSGGNIPSSTGVAIPGSGPASPYGGFSGGVEMGAVEVRAEAAEVRAETAVAATL